MKDESELINIQNLTIKINNHKTIKRLTLDINTTR
jgi:hypothetical protein